MDIKYTPAQEKAIYTKDKSLLLSAAAGSGKTAVLVGRIMNMISDPESPVNITDLLIVTFTNLAAAQMKERIYKELTARIKEQPDNKKLKKQLLYLSNAKIKTIHSFCLDLIKENIDCLDIPVGFRIADENEEMSVKRRVLSEFTEELYKAEDLQFYDIISTYASGRDDSEFEELILQLDRVTDGVENEDEFFEKCLEGLEKASENFSDSEYARLLREHIRLFCENALKKYDKAIEIAEFNPDFDRFVPFFCEERTLFEQFLEENDLNALKNIALGYKFKTFPSKRGVDTSALKNIRDSVKNSFIKTKVVPYLNFDFEAEEFQLTETAEHFKNMISVYKKYVQALEEEKRRKNILFFKDFEAYAIRLLKNEDGEPTKLAESLKKEFYEIMIDEYQDTSELQNSIFEIISKNGSNFFMVGDVKQSIYKFRNASPELFIKRANDYEDEKNGGELIMLKENFRSRTQVIDSVNSIFSRIMTAKTAKTDYSSQALVFGQKDLPEDSASDYTTEILLFSGKRTDGEAEDSSNEGRLIANRIKKLFADGFKVYDGKKKLFRPIRFSDIVILARDMKSVVTESIYLTLKDSGIPVQGDFDEEFWDKPEISAVTGILRAVDNPYDDLAVLTLLKSPSFHFSETELLEIRLCDEYSPFYISLKKSDSEKAKKTVAFLKKYSEKASILGISELLNELFCELKCYEYNSSLPEGKQKNASLDLLYAVACDFEKRESGTLKGFLNYIKRSRPKIQSEKNADAVKILTIHKSKGLEFPVVFVAGTGKSLFSKKTDAKFHIFSNRLVGMNYISAKDLYIIPSANMKIVKNAMEYDDISEKIRLLYVALTRAKEKLIITANVRSSNFARWEIVRETGGHDLYSLYDSNSYIDWIMPSAEISPFFKTILTEEVDDFSEKTDEKPKTSEKEVKEEKKETEEKKEEITTEKSVFYEYPNKERTTLPLKVTVSYANRLINEGESGGDKHFSVLELDGCEDKYSGSEYGTYFHKMFELCDISAVKGGETPRAVVNRLFENNMLEYTDYSEEAISGIEKFFETSLGRELLKSERICKETPFLVKITADKIFSGNCKDEILLQGATDCYFEENGEIVLLDFKTDKNPEEKKIRKNYEKQILLYAYALEKITGLKVSKKVIYTVRNSKIIEF